MLQLPSNPKYAFIGVGGVGGYFGGLLAASGADVTFIAREKTIEKLNSNGLKINTVSGSHVINPVKTSSSLSDISPDVVFFCIKTYDTAKAAEHLSELNNDSILLSIQNGINNDQVIKDISGVKNVFPGYARIISGKTDVNEITQTGGPCSIHFGEKDGLDIPALKTIADNMTRAGINAEYTKNIIPDMWEKFIFLTAFSGFTSIGKCTIGEILNDPKAYKLYQEACLECIEVARKSGVDLDKDIYNRVIKHTETYKGSKGGATSSMSRDFIAGNKTEIEGLSGAIENLGIQNSVKTPIHSMIAATIRLNSHHK